MTFAEIPARSLDALELEMAKARHRFHLSDSIPVITCYEAGRDGFWIHRSIEAQRGSGSSLTPNSPSGSNASSRLNNAV